MISIYLLCDYKSRIEFNRHGVGARCIQQANKGQYLIDPMQQIYATCADNLSDLQLVKKLEFICENLHTEEMIPWMYILITAILVLCVLSFAVCFVVGIILWMRRRRQGGQDQEAPRQRVSQRRSRRLKQYQENLVVQNYEEWQTLWKSKEDVEKLRSNTCCSICLEEYQAETKVRQTPCFHYFHDECLMQWIERSIQNPDCPYCKHQFKNKFQDVRYNRVAESPAVRQLVIA